MKVSVDQRLRLVEKLRAKVRRCNLEAAIGSELRNYRVELR
jgi:hypothetical protein